MPNFFDSADIIKIFDRFNRSDLKYILLRNSYNELPDKLSIGKDIDILVDINSKSLFHNIMQDMHFRKIRHPFKSKERLYGANLFEMYKNKKGVLVDVNYEFCVQSLDKGQLIPLDKKIQLNIWKNFKKVKYKNMNFNFMGNEEYFITMLSRLIYDKKEIDLWHKKELTRLLSIVDFDLVTCYSNLIFFKYTNKLLRSIKNKNFTDFFGSYLTFYDY